MDLTKKRKLDENGGSPEDSDTGLNKLTLEDAHKILEPFTPEQLFEIVKTAMVRDSGVLDAVRLIADRDAKQRKLFVRGLGWETTSEKLRALFSTFGDLEEAIVILDKATGKSKGYGFVTFKHVDGALLSLKEPSKTIDGRVTVSQIAASGVSGPTPNVPQAADEVMMRKIYVGNVPYEMPADRLLAHFSSYGEVEEGPLGFDKATGRSKGYALFVYKTAEAARASLVDPIKTIDGKSLTCKFAVDGKKGKPGMPVMAGPGGVQGPTGVPGETHSNGLGLHQPSSMPVLGSQYGGPGGQGGISSYGGFSGGLQGPPMPMGGGPGLSLVGGGPGLSSVGGGGPGLSSIASQAHAPTSLGSGYGSGLAGSFSGGYFGGPVSTGYGGLGGTGGGLGVAGTGLGGTGGGLGGAGTGGGLGGAGRGSSLYGLPPSSGGFHESAHYSLSASAYPSQHHQPAGTSPAPRVPPGGMYQRMPPYF